MTDSCATASLKNIRAANGEFSPAALRAILVSRLGFSDETRFVVALSGGADSVALLSALVAAGWQPRAVHVDHGLHPASGAWADSCAALCHQLGLSCQVERVQIGTIRERGYEAAAREARYARLMEVLGPGEVLVTAHHLDDQAETVLLQLLRGAGLAGLSAMPGVTPFGAGRLARPLLSFHRAELQAYLQASKFVWIEDDSNQDRARQRNLIRHDVLPQLTEHWPGAIHALARSARHAAQAQLLLDELAGQDILVAGGVADTLSVSKVVKLSAARQSNLIRFWLRRQGIGMPSEAQLGEIMRAVAQRPRSGGAIVKWPGATVRRYRDSLIALHPGATSGEWEPQSWDLAAPLVIPAAGVRLRPQPGVGIGLSLARVAGLTLSVRPRVGGEMCRPAGSRHHRSLKKLLQESNVPPWERARMPLLYVGEELAAVADRWVCEPFAAQASEASVQLVLEDLLGKTFVEHS